MDNLVGADSESSGLYWSDIIKYTSGLYGLHDELRSLHN